MNIRDIRPGTRVRADEREGSRGGWGVVTHACLPTRADVSMDDGRDFRCIPITEFQAGGRFRLIGD